MRYQSRWRRALSRFLTDEAGAQALEFVAILPMVLLVLILMLQMGLLAYAMVVAEASTREAALVASRDVALITSWPGSKGSTLIDAAAKRAAAGMKVEISAVECTSGEVTVRLQATVPNVLFDSAMQIERKVIMPTQSGRCS